MIAYATANPQCFDSKGRPWLFAIADNEGIRHCANCGEVLHSNRQKTYWNSMVKLFTSGNRVLDGKASQTFDRMILMNLKGSRNKWQK